MEPVNYMLMCNQKLEDGLRSSGAAFRAMLAQVIYDMEYRPSKADPDVYLKPAIKPNGFRYYEMLLVYSDDVLSISHQPLEAINGIKSVFKLKGDKATVPEMHLGGGISEVENSNGTKCWTMSSEKYVKAAVSNIEEKLENIISARFTKINIPV